MGKLESRNIERFNLGMTNNERHPDFRYFVRCKNFDTTLEQNSLIPYRDSESGDSSANTQRIANYFYYNSTLYGLGLVSGTSRVKVFKNTDLTGATWVELANGEDASGIRNTDVFVEYEGFAFGLARGTNIYKIDLSGVSAITAADGTIAYTNAAQGLFHTRHSVLYIPYDNKIARKSTIGGAWTTAALTLPSNQIITSICEYGNYLAILTRHSNGVSDSRVYLWDGDSDATDISEKLDLGAGQGWVLEELDGYLIAVSVIGVSSTSLKYKLVIKYYTGAGSGFDKLVEFESSTLPEITGKQRIDGRVLFAVSSITIGGNTMDGVWSVYKTDLGTLSVVVDKLPNNDTLVTSIEGFFQVGDYQFISHLTNGTWGVSKTNDQSTYTATSLVQTVKTDYSTSKDVNAKRKEKKLYAVTVTSKPLPSGGSIVVSYRTDASLSWTPLLTHDTDDEISKSVLGTSVSNFKEIQYLIESTGGAVITGFYTQAEVLDTDIYG